MRACLAMIALACGPVRAQQSPPEPKDAHVAFPTMEVDAVHLGIRPFDVPAALSVVHPAPASAGQPGVNLSESLVGVPGILARNRQNYAQDLQVSIRGFGARTTFGVRGIRLYADGIPASLPDGQGQVSHFNFDSAERIEVLRGPFSVLYGNAAGGVVQLWSAEGTPTPVTTLGANFGSNDSFRYGINTRGTFGRVDYNVSASDFRSAGYRRHSRVQRESDNARFGVDLGDRGKLTLVANRLNQPVSEDPLGMTPAQAHADPRQAASAAIQYNTRKRILQDQVGGVFERQLDNGNQLRLMAYSGQRKIVQYQSIPASSERNPLSAGGVIVLDTDYGGIDARWTRDGEVAGRQYEFVAGFAGDRQLQHRRGYNNFIGDTLGVRGALRRDEDDNVGSTAGYLQWYWDFAKQWSLLLGVRHEEVRFRAHDRHVTATNPDDSGRVGYVATTPVAGLVFRPRANLRLYASYGKGFETPSFNELGYRSDGSPGLAFDLRPALSRNLELGAKWHPAPALAIEAAAFRSDTRDELAIATNENGRSTYRNVGTTRRQGIEVSMTGQLGHGWQASAAATRVEARFRTPFSICRATPCVSANIPVAANTRIPGVPEHYGSLRLQHGGNSGWREGIELTGVGSVTVEDTGVQHASGHGLVSIDAGYTFSLTTNRRLQVSARIDNLANRRYIGSVIVNDGNGRYFEPGPGRSCTIGARLTF